MNKVIYLSIISLNLLFGSSYAFFGPSYPESRSYPNAGPGNGGPTVNYGCDWVLIDDIPVIGISMNEEDPKWECKKDAAALYAFGDQSQMIGMISHVTVEEAKKIADSDPNITCFFYVITRVLLANADEHPLTYQSFNPHDAVFFSGQPKWAYAPNLATGYIKISDTNQAFAEKEDDEFSDMVQTYLSTLNVPKNTDIIWKAKEKVIPVKMGDWSKAIGRANYVPLDYAKEIAASDLRITHFYYVHRGDVKLTYETTPTTFRNFQLCDAIFFTGKPQWESDKDSDATVHCYVKSL